MDALRQASVRAWLLDATWQRAARFVPGLCQIKRGGRLIFPTVVHKELYI